MGTAQPSRSRGAFLCDKYTYFSLNRLCDRSLALAFHHPLGPCRKLEGSFLPVGLRCLLLAQWCHSLTELPRPAAVGVCEAHKHGGRSSVVGCYQAEKT